MAATASTIDPEEIEPVSRMARREEQLVGELGVAALQRVAAMAAMKSLLGGG